MSSSSPPNNPSGALPLISQVDGKFLLDCDEIEGLEEYVLAGIRLPQSESVFEAIYPREKIVIYLTSRGKPKLYDVIKSAVIAVSTSCLEFQRNTLVLIRDFGGEISVFAQEAQRSLAEIISGLEARVRSGGKDASAFKEHARALLARNQESYNQKMEKYRDFQKETQKFTVKVLEDQEHLNEAVDDLTEAVEKKTKGGSVFKTFSLGVILAALAIGNFLTLGNLQEMTDKKYREFRESLRQPGEPPQGINVIRSLAKLDTEERLQKALERLAFVLNEFQLVGTRLNDLREKFRGDVDLDGAALSELRETLKGWQKVQSAGERFQDK